MTEFTVHTPQSAPGEAGASLEQSNAAFGMVPNLHAVMAESPEHLEAYKTLHGLFQNTSFTPTERTVVWMAHNVENNCHYCVPAHTLIAHGEGVEASVIDDLRAARPLSDAKLEALRQFTLRVIRQRGVLTDDETQAFLNAGYERRHILDVILGVAQKVMSNYVNHFADTPVDAPFAKHAWTPSTVPAE